VTKYILRQDIFGQEDQHSRVCVVLAGSKEEAIHNARVAYGGDWMLMQPHSTLKELEQTVEDSTTESILLNL
jgi:hypothetical protein